MFTSRSLFFIRGTFFFCLIWFVLFLRIEFEVIFNNIEWKHDVIHIENQSQSIQITDSNNLTKIVFPNGTTRIIAKNNNTITTTNKPTTSEAITSTPTSSITSASRLITSKPICFQQTNFSEPIVNLVINETVLPSKELDRLFPHIRTGGHWEPEHCQAQQKLGIFIPLRDRWHHLPILLRHLHQLLVSQQCHYTFYVIEQGDENPFNRGKLFNVGVIEALKLEPDLNCFILHDVDTLPETNLTIYKCHNESRLALEMATYQKKKKYKQVYDGYAGGVLAIHRAQYENINGFSNEYWGWGFEDDELTARLRKKGYDVVQERSRGGYFYSLDHTQAKANPHRIEVRRKHQSTNLFNEGLNSTDYVLTKMEKKRLFTFFKVNTTITVP